MADVYAVFGTLLALGIAFPGMLTAWWLMFGGVVNRARTRWDSTPGRCFFLGSGVALLASVPIGVLLALPVGPARFVGALLIVGLLAFASLGAAGLAASMTGRLQARSASTISEAGAFLRAAVALELAAAFPIIGWFIFVPSALLTSLGAATFAALHWMPTSEKAHTPEAATSGV